MPVRIQKKVPLACTILRCDRDHWNERATKRISTFIIRPTKIRLHRTFIPYPEFGLERDHKTLTVQDPRTILPANPGVVLRGTNEATIFP